MPRLTRAEPVQTMCDAVPPVPKGIGEVGAEKWKELAGYMHDNGNLAFVFLPTLERLCKCYDKMAYLEARYLGAQEAHNLIQDKKRTNPIYRMWLACDTQIAKYLEVLGMTPKSRKNANLPVAGNNGNPMSNKTKQGQGSRPKNIDKEMDFPRVATG